MRTLYTDGRRWWCAADRDELRSLLERWVGDEEADRTYLYHEPHPAEVVWFLPHPDDLAVTPAHPIIPHRWAELFLPGMVGLQVEGERWPRMAPGMLRR